MTETHARGIDVSHYQGKIDWKKVTQAGVNFAFIKVTDGTNSTDSYFAANWMNARQAGIRRGAYHFFRAQEDAALQAKQFVAALGNDVGELPPVLDFEVLGGISSKQALQSALGWMIAVERATSLEPM